MKKLEEADELPGATWAGRREPGLTLGRLVKPWPLKQSRRSALGLPRGGHAACGPGGGLPLGAHRVSGPGDLG